MCKDLPTVPLPSAVTQCDRLQSSIAASASSAILNITPDYQQRASATPPPTQEEWQFTDSSHIVESQMISPDVNNSSLEPSPVPKPQLQLPVSEESWVAANALFEELLVPDVLNQPSADGKHAMITEGLYKYFATTHGVKPQKRKRRRQQRIVCQVRDAREAKRTACRELNQARKSPPRAYSIHCSQVSSDNPITQ